jgi:Tol biopolymer transport system component
MLFSTDLHGSPVIFKTGANGRAGRQVSEEEPADLGSISPSGTWMSWVDPPGHLVLTNTRTGESKKVRDPVEILSSASWSPDEGQVLVEAFDWGAPHVYMIDVATGYSLRLTASIRGDGMPSWSPNGEDALVVSGREGQPAIWKLSNLKPYVARIKEPDDVKVFERPANTRVPAPPDARRFRSSVR